MSKKNRWIVLIALIIVIVATLLFLKREKPHNIILFISDGCGFNHIAATSIFQYGEKGKQVYHQFPLLYAMSTFSMNNPEYDPQKAWRTFEYVLNKPTDSAASSTAMATGIKTLNGKVGVDTNNIEVKNAVEHFESLGKSTGVVTSVTFAQATPACFVVHDSSRDNYSDIARKMIMEGAIDVIMGCGHPYYDDVGKPTNKFDFEKVGGKKVWDALLQGVAGTDANGDSISDYWKFIEDRSDFQKMMSGPTPSRVIGIPKVRGTLQADREGDNQADAYTVPFNKDIPTLAEMTQAALNILDENEKGFFLMVEGGAVDWAAHDNLSGRMIEEEIDFNKTVEATIEWLNKNSSWEETTIIVTADHETGYLTGPGSNDTSNVKQSLDLWKPLINNGKGKMPGMQWNSSGHSNSLVPFFAKGAHAEDFRKYAVNEDPVRGAYLDNTNIGMFLLSITE